MISFNSLVVNEKQQDKFNPMTKPDMKELTNILSNISNACKKVDLSSDLNEFVKFMSNIKLNDFDSVKKGFELSIKMIKILTQLEFVGTETYKFSRTESYFRDMLDAYSKRIVSEEFKNKEHD